MNNQSDYSKLKQRRNSNSKQKNKNIIYTTRDIAMQIRRINTGEIPSDTMGSYTGTSHDGGAPEQDADDL